MQRGRRRALLFLLLVLPGIVGAAAFWYLPRAEVPRDDPLPEGDFLVVAHGVVRDGGARHRAGGLVTLYEERTTLERGLYFENYTARSGPNVWFFLTSMADPEARGDVMAGVELRVPALGPAVARGSFWVPVPGEVAPGDAGAVVAWDRHLGARFAVATLEPAAEPPENMVE